MAESLLRASQSGGYGDGSRASSEKEQGTGSDGSTRSMGSTPSVEPPLPVRVIAENGSRSSRRRLSPPASLQISPHTVRCCICNTSLGIPLGFISRLKLFHHHCGKCGQPVCTNHSRNSLLLPQQGRNKETRVCDTCAKSLYITPLWGDGHIDEVEEDDFDLDSGSPVVEEDPGQIQGGILLNGSVEWQDTTIDTVVYRGSLGLTSRSAVSRTLNANLAIWKERVYMVTHMDLLLFKKAQGSDIGEARMNINLLDIVDLEIDSQFPRIITMFRPDGRLHRLRSPTQEDAQKLLRTIEDARKIYVGAMHKLCFGLGRSDIYVSNVTERLFDEDGAPPRSSSVTHPRWPTPSSPKTAAPSVAPSTSSGLSLQTEGSAIRRNMPLRTLSMCDLSVEALRAKGSEVVLMGGRVNIWGHSTHLYLSDPPGDLCVYLSCSLGTATVIFPGAELQKARAPGKPLRMKAPLVSAAVMVPHQVVLTISAEESESSKHREAFSRPSSGGALSSPVLDRLTSFVLPYVVLLPGLALFFWGALGMGLLLALPAALALCWAAAQYGERHLRWAAMLLLGEAVPRRWRSRRRWRVVFKSCEVCDAEKVSEVGGEGGVSGAGGPDGGVELRDEDIPERFVEGMKDMGMEVVRQRYENTLRWRKENNIDHLLREPMPHFDVLKKAYPNYVHKTDKEGHYIVVEKAGKMKEGLRYMETHNTSPSDALRVLVFLQEYQIAFIDPRPLPFGTYVKIIDIDGISMSDVGGEVLSYMKMAGQVIGEHYPERSHQTFVLRGKQIGETLLKFVDADSLPVEYGGTCRCGPNGCMIDSPDEVELRKYVAKLNDPNFDPDSGDLPEPKASGLGNARKEAESTAGRRSSVGKHLGLDDLIDEDLDDPQRSSETTQRGRGGLPPGSKQTTTPTDAKSARKSLIPRKRRSLKNNPGSGESKSL